MGGRICNSVKLRELTESDHPFLLELFKSTREQELASVPWSEDQKSFFVKQQYHAQHSHYMNNYDCATFHIIEEKDEPIGRLYVDRGTDDIRIIDISLLPHARNRGIGSYYLNELLAESQEYELPISIHVEKNNPARSLYKRLGFEVKDDLGVYLFLERPVN